MNTNAIRQGAARIAIGRAPARACTIPTDRPEADVTLAALIEGCDAFDIAKANNLPRRGVPNLGRCGIAACAIPAIDLALRDLKARLLSDLLWRERDHIAIYGSGGSPSYDNVTLRKHLHGWVACDSCQATKIKIGSDPTADPRRINHLRIEQMLFEGAPEAKDGLIEPGLSLPGNGLTFKAKNAEIHTI